MEVIKNNTALSKKNSFQIAVNGFFIFLALVALGIIVPRLKNSLFNPHTNTPKSLSVKNPVDSAPITSGKETSQAVDKTPVPTPPKPLIEKSAAITEADLNTQLLKGMSSNSMPQGSLNIKIYDGFISATVFIDANKNATVNSSLSTNGKSLKTTTYNFVGFQGLTDELKGQFADLLTKGVLEGIKDALGATEIKSLILQNGEVQVVYF